MWWWVWWWVCAHERAEIAADVVVAGGVVAFDWWLVELDLETRNLVYCTWQSATALLGIDDFPPLAPAGILASLRHLAQEPKRMAV